MRVQFDLQHVHRLVKNPADDGRSLGGQESQTKACFAGDFSEGATVATQSTTVTVS